MMREQSLNRRQNQKVSSRNRYDRERKNRKLRSREEREEERKECQKGSGSEPEQEYNDRVSLHVDDDSELTDKETTKNQRMKILTLALKS